MTYAQTLGYLYEKLPMFHRVGAAAYKADLSNTVRLAEILGRPHTRFRSVHVAGTNGKGSTSHMLAAILQQCGYRTGLYTSPHLVDFRERVRINGKMIPKNCVVEFVEKHRAHFEEIQPSFFEWTVALAFDYFANEEVDVAIIETGLGGRLDSTNIITPQLSIITNIGLDHTNLLGDTLEQIAREKAGIIKPRVPVVISQYQSETAPVFSNIARELKSPFEFADKNYRITSHSREKDGLHVTVLNRKTEASDSYVLDLKGLYQLKNLPGVLNALEYIEKAGFVIQPENVRKGLSQVCRLTGLSGRWQTLKEKPLVIADTGHNSDGIRMVVDGINALTYDHLHMVIGAVNDKDVSSMLALLPRKAEYYFVKADIPRALPAADLAKEAQKYKLHGRAFETVHAGVKAALKAAGRNDLVFIGGSTFVVGEALPEFQKS
jgi:dihydrofolate synthase / folylpolyglutamate synthase